MSGTAAFTDTIGGETGGAFRSVFPARYYSGEVPVGRPAEVHVGPLGLTIRMDSESQLWPYEGLRQPRRARHGEPIHLERGEGREVLVCFDPAILTAIRRASPGSTRHIRPASRIPFLAWAALLIGGIGVAFALLVAFGIPSLAGSVAQSIPVSWEVQFGDAMLEHVAPERLRIRDPRVVAPVERIARQLAAARPGPYRYRVVVVDAPEVNALAAPGGRIAVFRGLIEFARTPEELAGVVAHEMEHVRRRHVTEGILKSASLGLLISLVAGDVSGPAAAGIQMARKLGELSYSRDAESEADADAIDWLVAAHVDPRTLPEMLARLPEAGAAPQWADFLATHPAPQARARVLRETLARLSPAPSRPLLSEDEWAGLRAAVARGTKAGGSRR